jgi:IS5 family transposase
MTDTADFFRIRLDQMVDLRHSLVVLAPRMPWLYRTHQRL